SVPSNSPARVSSMSTVPGRAKEVSLLERFTVVPNTSPCMDTTGTEATTTRTSGTSTWVRMPEARRKAMSAASAAESTTYSTSYASVLTDVPSQEATMTAAVSSKLSTTPASSTSSSSLLRVVKETRSAKPTMSG